MRKKLLVDNIWFHFRDSNIGIENKKGEEVCPITRVFLLEQSVIHGKWHNKLHQYFHSQNLFFTHARQCTGAESGKTNTQLFQQSLVQAKSPIKRKKQIFLYICCLGDVSLRLNLLTLWTKTSFFYCQLCKTNIAMAEQAGIFITGNEVKFRQKTA